MYRKTYRATSPRLRALSLVRGECIGKRTEPPIQESGLLAYCGVVSLGTERAREKGHKQEAEEGGEEMRTEEEEVRGE